ncbi:MAG TPA: aldehyde ferredoxin oxidoreductase C-terminal domain-containing protein [Anaerolineae bacterium]|nr:aldehyde ferredoxin oxidoreductase C-terminal domain-containing protein [Anaerolineae bacterium]
MNRRLLLINSAARRWRLETLPVETLNKDPREDYLVLSGETLCQYLLRRDAGALVIARGPLPFLSGNKATVGYVSPLTGVPHYSLVGGRAAAQLFNLGLDAICFQSANQQISKSANQQISKSANQQISRSVDRQIAGPQSAIRNPQSPFSILHSPFSILPIVVVSGRAPNLSVEFKDAAELPAGQRSAFYWLLEKELGGDKYGGSIFTIGEGAYLGYASANLAVEAIYHAGRGGAGNVFARFAAALVLRGEPVTLSEFFASVPPLPAGEGRGEGAFARDPNSAIAALLDRYCARLSGKTGGTIVKLFTSGADPAGKPTLPARNAQQMGSPVAGLGSPQVLKATRQGQTGCHWCQVDCRHTHHVPADYAPGGQDVFLDDFEPTYAVFAMLGLAPAQDTLQARLDLRAEVDRRLILPIEQMGCDVMNVGTGLAALFEGIERGIIPHDDVPDFVANQRISESASRQISKSANQQIGESVNRRGGETGHVKGSEQWLEAAVQAVAMLRSGQAAEYPALRAAGDGPQALAEQYPAMQDVVFTGGKGTLGNAGHCNALWTFLMPFSRFVGHYVGQYYKVEEELPPPGSRPEAYRACFEQVVGRLLGREFFWLLANALSQCAFTFIIFSQDGEGERLSDDGLLVRILRHYGIHTTRADLEWFSQAFWAQSVDLKRRFGWRPPAAADFPRRVYEALSLALGRPVEELQALMDLLIAEWKRQAGEVMRRFGYEATW